MAGEALTASCGAKNLIHIPVSAGLRPWSSSAKSLYEVEMRGSGDEAPRPIDREC